MSELKPCPFCGGKAKGVRAAKAYHIFCQQCGADVMASTTKAMTSCQVEKQNVRATDKWNTRKDGWISVDDRLPTEDGIYLTVTEVGSVEVKQIVKMTRFQIRPAYSYFVDGDWHRTTHWMPLPSAPVETKSE